MTTTTTQKIPWAKLPGKIREVLSAEETVGTLEHIGEKYGLSDMERGFLMRITGKLLSGGLPPTEFVKSIVEQIDIDRDQAILVAQEINRDIFNEIKDLLKELHSVEEKKPGVPVGVVPAPKIPGISSAPVVKPAGEPIRSDWGWHGKKNEATGQIEFKHEGTVPDLSGKHVTPLPQTTAAGAAHVGSLFEQKLGGTFTLKATTATTGGSPQATPTPPAPLSTAAMVALHVPHKPTQVPIPPVQVFQQPRNE